MIDFLNPNYYDVSEIPDDVPNKPLLVELYERMNEQNERLWMFFTEMTESPDYCGVHQTPYTTQEEGQEAGSGKAPCYRQSRV